MLAGQAIDYRQFAFVHIGSGKGQGLFAASNFPFRQIIGLEFDRRLHEIATKNVGSYKSVFQKCFKIETILCREDEQQMRTGQTICFFDRPVKKATAATLATRFLTRIPTIRSGGMIILCYDSCWAEEFDASPCCRRISGEHNADEGWYCARYVLEAQQATSQPVTSIEEESRHRVCKSTNI